MVTTSDASHLIVLIFGAAALLLWGTRMARTGITRAYGQEIRGLISSGLSNRFVAAGSGLASAAVLQSSMAVALFLASFTRLGAVSVATGLAVMLGADIGSAVVASLLTLNIKQLWPVLIAVGFVVHTAYDGRNAKGKQLGRVMLGLGLVLLALSALGVAAQNLSSSEVLQLVLVSLAGQNVLVIVIVALLTWLAHSSIAILLLVASMAAAGVLTTPELIVAIVLGINIGGGIPAILLTWSETVEARRIAVGNGLFRLLGAALAFAFIPDIAKLYAMMPEKSALAVIALHLAFNFCLVLLCLPIVGPVARLLATLIKPPENAPDDFGPKFINGNIVQYPPSLAISALLRETIRMIDLVEDMLGKSQVILMKGDRAQAGEVHHLDDRLDTLYEAIKSSATDLTREELEIGESRRAVDIISYAANLENAGDLIEKNLLDTVENKVKSSAQFSSEGEAEIVRLFGYVKETAHVAAGTAMSWELGNAQVLIGRKSEFKSLAKESLEKHLQRLRKREQKSLETSSFHLDLLGDLQRVNSLLCGIGYSVRQSHLP
ncbi:MAG: Na/Pi cotransporter family protein [Hyphomicrobiaceae bacterium]